MKGASSSEGVDMRLWWTAVRLKGLLRMALQAIKGPGQVVKVECKVESGVNHTSQV